MDTSINITEYIRDGYIILVPVLYILGNFIKRSEKINGRYIPLILTILGMVFGICISFIKGDFVLEALVNGSVQGILTAGAAVLSNQIIKQMGKKDES